MSRLFMLDTNAVSAFMHENSPALDRRVAEAGKERLVVSAISHGETLYGLAMNPGARRLRAAAAYLFTTVTILDWTLESSRRYGALRAEMRRLGKALQPLDMLIAAHALEAGATLVSNDRAFRHVPGLTVEDWAA
jgi:tRNA(fMet)-specific endonuclease VapC